VLWDWFGQTKHIQCVWVNEKPECVSIVADLNQSPGGFVEIEGSPDIPQQYNHVTSSMPGT
jgi:hypothetical protein